jgi:two-component system NtrC family sensor kinase
MHLDQLEGLARALFEESGDALFLFDPETDELLDVNPLVEKLTGFSRQELLRAPATSLFRFGGKGGKERLRRAAQHSGVFHSQEGYYLRTKHGGGWLPVNLTTSRLHLKPKTLALITARDVRERREAEEALQQERHLLHTLLDNLPEGIYFKDAAGRFLRVNAAQARWLGLTDPAEAIGKTDFDFFTEEHARQARADEDEVMRTGRPLIGKEEKETWPDGRVTWVLTTKLPLRDPQGKIIGTFGISRDITRRKQSEEERARLLAREQEARRELESVLGSLRRSEARFRGLFESSIVGMAVMDLTGRLTDANDAFLRLTGYERSDLPLSWDGQMTPPEHRALDQRAIEQLRGGGVAAPYEKDLVRKDGGRVPVLFGAARLAGSADQCVCFALDMTERNRMRAVVAQSEKLASIGLLSAGIAHEINNPLAYVGNNLTVLEKCLHGLRELVDVYESARDRLAQADPEAAEKARALAERIDLPYVRSTVDRVLKRTAEGVKRITRIVQGLRGVARTDPGEMEQVQASDLLDMSLEMVRGRMKQSGIALEVSCPPGLLLHCSATQLSQVLLNLLINAVQAVESAKRGEAGRIALRARQENGEAVIEVEDNGCGIEPRDLPRIFDPFFTRKPVGEGTGLGLSISHGIVTGHGGRIEVESQIGKGSTFRVFLPLSESEPRR